MFRPTGDNAVQPRKVFKYEVITSLTPENTQTITEILKCNDIGVVPEAGIMGTMYYGVKDSAGKMLCFAEREHFDRPCVSYRICLGDYRANNGAPVEIANLNCWYKEVSKGEQIKSVRKGALEKQILEMYDRIRQYQNNKHR